MSDRRLMVFIAAALLGWFLTSATVSFFDSPKQVLWMGHEGRTDLKPEVSGSALERRDMVNTARAIAQFAHKYEDDCADELEQFAHAVIGFLEGEES